MPISYDTALFTLSDVQVRHKQKVLLATEHLQLPARQLIAIIGANGAGKSTLLHAMLGRVAGCDLLGQIHCQGSHVDRLIGAGKLAWVGQHERFEAPLDVLGYALLGTMPSLAWYQQPSREAVATAKQYLVDFDLLNLQHQRIQTLSGGEKQRLAVVRALMQNTDILLLDEPTNHLDIKHQRKLFAYLRHLVCEQHKSIVMVLHSLTDAYNHADYVVALADGNVVAQGTPEKVMTNKTLSRMYEVDICAHQTEQGVVFI